ncbi:MAG: hypothetical protein ACM30E_01530, partial [Nitrososphaerales archaeon]
RSLAVAGVVFVLSSIGVWALWTQAALPNYGGSYQVPWPQASLALLCAGILVAVTLAVRPPALAARQAGRRAVSPWLAGVLAFVFGLVWWLLVVFAFLDRAMLPGLSPVAPLVAGLGWAGLAWLTVRRLARAGGWEDIQRLALIYGALLASMLGGAFSVITAAPIDRLGKLLFDLVAVVLLAALAARLRRQPAPA